MAETSIEWSDAVWNPLSGCTRVSAGCGGPHGQGGCYAERLAYRLAAMGQKKYEGLTRKVGDEIRWTGEVRLIESALDLPLRWRKRRRIFVNSMSDLFHEKVSDEWINRILGVADRCRQHTFQILTKRPLRMLSLLSRTAWARAPLPNVWLGVSVEDQATADERIPLLLQTPAVVRWVSCEPTLGPVDFAPWLTCRYHPSGPRSCVCGMALDWLVIGGESGPQARPFDLAWGRSALAQCRTAGVAVFVKQLGAHPCEGWVGGEGGIRVGSGMRYRDRKGADPSEWPADLRVREFPSLAPHAVTTATADLWYHPGGAEER